MIHFDELEHKYTDDQGNDYISVTQLIAKYKQPFDTVKVATRYAENHGQTPEYWIQLWEDGKNEACDRGTLFHEEKEDFLLGRGVDMNRGEAVIVHNPSLVSRTTPDIFKYPDGLYPELRLWHEGYRLAGTADKTFFASFWNIKNTNSKEWIRFVDIDDHKTNKAIYTKSYYSPTTGFKMMKYPVQHLMDCNFTHYELQISFYAYMLECMGFVIRDLQFTHYPHHKTEEQMIENPFQEQNPAPVVYPLRYLKAEVIEILEDYRKSKRKKR